jgi:hypothetical protein
VVFVVIEVVAGEVCIRHLNSCVRTVSSTPPFSLTCRAMDGQWAPLGPQFSRNTIPSHSSSSP